MNKTPKAKQKLSAVSAAYKKLTGRLSKKMKIGIAAVLLILLAILIPTGINHLHRPQAEVLTVSTLQDILNVSDLSTFEAVYNGITDVHNHKKPEKIDYHVSYEARVQAGIDFEQLAIDLDSSSKVITITLPPVKITDITVEIGTLDYIFENDKANTSTVSQEAYKACIADVTEESAEQKAIYTLAEENAKNIIEALVNPFVKQLDAGYTLEIRGEEAA